MSQPLFNYHAISLASTNATSLKAVAANLQGFIICNSNAAARYAKFYDKASAPTVGTDIPLITALIPAGQNINFYPGEKGIKFRAGLAYALTTGLADTDTGAVGASDLSLSVFYS